MKHVFTILSVVLLFAIAAVTFAQESTPEVVEDNTPALVENLIETSNRNSALTTLAFGGLLIVGVLALGLAAYTSNQQSQNLPPSVVITIIKSLADAASRAALPIALDMAKSTQNKLDDAAIEAVLLASRWAIVKDDAGNLVSATPPPVVPPDNVSVTTPDMDTFR